MLPDNNWYGHKSILLNYLGLKQKKIFASLMHGWVSDYHFQFIKKKKTNFFPYLVWSKKIEDFYLKRNIKNVISIGAPFLYLCKIYSDKLKKIHIKNSLPKGLIFFPPHSSQDYKPNIDHKKFIEKIIKINKGPYTVCLYYYDFKSDVIAIYKRYNWRIVCCVKNRTDPYSLYNLYKEISLHEYVVSGELNSPLFYSMYLKKKTRVMLIANKSKNKLDQMTSRINFIIKYYKKKYPDLFKRFFPVKKAFKLSRIELGENSLKSKKKLKKILGLNSVLKIFLANFFSILYDVKYGANLRKGKDLSNKQLRKYIAVSRD